MRYVPRLDRAAVIEATHHTREIWGEGRTAIEHTAHTEEQLARAGDLLRYVGLVDDAGDLIASSKRYALSIRGPSGEALRTMGVGAVFVPEVQRGRGAASALLRAMMNEARELGDAAAWLYSDIDPAFYERLGFRAFPAARHVALTRDLPREDPLGLRRATDEDMIWIASMYDESFADSFVRPLRSLEVLRYFFWRNQLDAWLFEDGERDVGYFFAARSEPDGGAAPSLWIDEWAALDIPTERVLATFRAIAEERGRESVATWPRPDRAVAALQPTPRAKAIPMLAALDEGAWLSAIDPSRAHFGSFDHF